MTYQEALDYIASLEPRGWRLGLDRMQEFARRLDLGNALGAPGGPQFIHVAGTNGKGSVTAYLQSMLIETGYSTGSFFSPYVFDPRERIQIGRRYIPENIFALMTELVRPTAESMSDTEFGGITEFEFKTALGFLFWKEMEAEWVAMEVGLGGRLDATNIITPRASVITSISYDHTHILGDTLEKIAFEKAGIIKPGVPVIVGAMPEEARRTILNVAEESGSTAWVWDRDIKVAQDPSDAKAFVVETPAGQHGGLKLGIKGAMQGHNMALAVAAMDAAGASRTLRGLVEGSKSAWIPGRFQRLKHEGREIILDGAHNEEAGKVLAESIRMHLWDRPTENVKRKDRVILVSGMVSGHEHRPFYATLAGLADELHLVPIDFHRAADPHDIASEIGDLFPKVQVHPSPEAGLQAAVSSAVWNDLVVVTGSFYLVGEIGRSLSL